MNILLVNDDGIQSGGIACLEETLSEIAVVYVVAPDSERSACSHSITLRRPIVARRVSERKYAVDGVPADCVNLALLNLFADVKFDLLVSGVNNGHNTGEDISYSGTVAGAIEATSLGVRSIAVSIGFSEKPNFGPACQFTRDLITHFPMDRLPDRAFLNVNLPRGDGPFPVMVTRQGKLHFENKVAEVDASDSSPRDPDTARSLRIHRTTEPHRSEEGTDVYAVNNGFISITPMHSDLTDRGAVELTEALVQAAFGAGERG